MFGDIHYMYFQICDQAFKLLNRCWIHFNGQQQIGDGPERL